jgi:hypothetical protein
VGRDAPQVVVVVVAAAVAVPSEEASPHPQVQRVGIPTLPDQPRGRQRPRSKAQRTLTQHGFLTSET